LSIRKNIEEESLWLKMSEASGQNGKKERVHCVGKIKETVKKTNFEVRFLHNMKKSSKFVSSDVEDEAVIKYP
jgi:hypothetical protein